MPFGFIDHRRAAPKLNRKCARRGLVQGRVRMSQILRHKGFQVRFESLRVLCFWKFLNFIYILDKANIIYIYKNNLFGRWEYLLFQYLIFWGSKSYSYANWVNYLWIFVFITIIQNLSYSRTLGIFWAIHITGILRFPYVPTNMHFSFVFFFLLLISFVNIL